MGGKIVVTMLSFPSAESSVSEAALLPSFFPRLHAQSDEVNAAVKKIAAALLISLFILFSSKQFENEFQFRFSYCSTR